MHLALDIQILHIQRVVLDELPSRLHVFTHQRGENGLALRDVFQFHREQRAPFRIHGGLPKLRRGHFAQAFIALHDKIFAPFVQHILEQIAGVGFLHHFHFFALRRGFRRFLLGLAVHTRLFGLALALFSTGGGRSSLDYSFHHKRRLHIHLDLLVFRNQLPALRGRRQFPVDD